MADPPAAVRECLRVLGPGGVLCIMEPNQKLLAHAREQHPDHPEPADPRPMVADLPVEVSHSELFDTCRVRRR